MLEGYDRIARQTAAHPDGAKSKETFRDLRGTLTAEQVKKETERCLGCGATVVDEFICVGCGACTTKCKFDAIKLVRTFDGQGAELREMKPIVIKFAIRRKIRIMLKKPFKAVAKLFR